MIGSQSDNPLRQFVTPVNSFNLMIHVAVDAMPEGGDSSAPSAIVGGAVAVPVISKSRISLMGAVAKRDEPAPIACDWRQLAIRRVVAKRRTDNDEMRRSARRQLRAETARIHPRRGRPGSTA